MIPLQRLAFGLALMALVAGCADRAIPTPTSEPPTTSPSPTSCPAEACNPPIAEPIPTNLTFSGCHGYVHNFAAKEGIFNPEYPRGLESDGLIDEAGLQIFTCAQAVLGPVVVQDFEYAYFFTLVANPDSEERQTFSQLLPLTFYSNSPAFIGIAQTHGLNVILAPSLGNVSRTPLASNHDWTNFVYPSDTKHFNFSGQVGYMAGPGYEWWNGIYYDTSTSLRRIIEHKAGRATGSDEGLMEFGPDSYWAKHSPVDRYEDGVNYYEGIAVEFNFDSQWSKT